MPLKKFFGALFLQCEFKMSMQLLKPSEFCSVWMRRGSVNNTPQFYLTRTEGPLNLPQIQRHMYLYKLQRCKSSPLDPLDPLDPLALPLALPLDPPFWPSDPLDPLTLFTLMTFWPPWPSDPLDLLTCRSVKRSSSYIYLSTPDNPVIF